MRTRQKLLAETLACLHLPATELALLGLSSGPLRLRRAWPRSKQRLALEYVTTGKETIAGQWFGEAGQLRRVAKATAQASGSGNGQSIVLEDRGVLLQSGGTDRKLRGLAALVARREATLLLHRPERRAVVRLNRPDGLRFAKVVRREHVRRHIDAGRALSRLNGLAFLAPELMDVDAEAGAATWSALSGNPLMEWLQAPGGDGPGRRRTPVNSLSPSDLALSSSLDRVQISAFSKEIGRALRSLHDAVPPPSTRRHDAVDEANVLLQWLGRLRLFGLDRCGQSGAAERVLRRLENDPAQPALLHRDFYDKQVFVDCSGRVGLLDFDTLAAGEAALDLANMLVHLELRVLQGHYLPEAAGIAADALLEGYRPGKNVFRRLQAYADASRLRLACVYAFRPRSHEGVEQASVVQQLMARLGRPLPSVAKHAA